MNKKKAFRELVLPVLILTVGYYLIMNYWPIPSKTVVTETTTTTLYSTSVTVSTQTVTVSTQTLTDRIPEYTYANIQVLDENNNPISGAQISITYATWIGTPSDASGLAVVNSRPVPSIQIWKDGYQTMTVRLDTRSVVLKKLETPSKSISYNAILSEIFKSGSKWTFTTINESEYLNLRYEDDYYIIFVRQAILDRTHYKISLEEIFLTVRSTAYNDAIVMQSPRIDIILMP